ncbi:steroid delta-isomerase [Thermocatellispora tengchongensis]|uniref:Steroid delta-isomerase n=1 Tax=Thermocatellispora tengchongensis TaxID=1073253 RepID=A0A840P8M1_9ACTN|nr:nuclear transport factor 2 family protein [Thermocatellispora tengchongensis]MBB5136018.1 steroid delta-isomerase [Thermocatellispora tengchongensis]
MLDEIERKEIINEYFKRVNAGDVEGVFSMLAPDAVVEDPIGYEPRKGERALREYLRFNLVDCQIQDTVEKMVAGQDGRSVAVALTCDSVNYMDPNKSHVKINCIVTFLVNEQGLIDELRSFWSFKDLETG